MTGGWGKFWLLLVCFIAGVALALQGNAQAAVRTPEKWSSRVVYVQGNLGKGYDIKKAVEPWDNRSKLDLRYVKKCPAGKPCIKVTRKNFRGDQVGDATTWHLAGRIVRCDVQIDTAAVKRFRIKPHAAVSHEVGHCLGFDHGHAHDVMYPYLDRHTSHKPPRKYLDALRKAYGK